MSRRPTIRLGATQLEDRWTPAVGDLDPGFGTAGSFRPAPEPVGSSLRYTSFELIAALPDGRMVVAGTSNVLNQATQTTSDTAFRVIRLTVDGKPDPTFNGGQYVETPFANDLLVQPDGKILLAGSSTGLGQRVLTVTRLTADGRPDPGFGSNGTAEVSTAAIGFGQPAAARALALRPDGRVLVVGSVGAGEFRSGGTTAAEQLQTFAVVQLTADGQPDPTFGGDGLVAVDFPSGTFNTAAANAVAVQSDGKVVVSGNAVAGLRTETIRFFTSAYTDRRTAVARLNPDGSLDTGFGSGGRVLVGSAEAQEPFFNSTGAVQVRPDGRIAVSDPVAGLALLTPAGQLDPSFDDDGLLPNRGGQTVFQPDGGALLAGTRAIVRLTPAGRGQPDDGPDGVATLPFSKAPVPTGYPFVGFDRVALLPDGTLAATADVTDAQGAYPSGAVYRLRGAAAAPFAAVPSTVLAGGTPDGSVAVLAPVTVGYTTVAGSQPYPNFGGNVRTATADVNGDGVPDYVVGPGPGGGPNVVVTDGKTGARLADLNAFETSFTGGVFVAAADLNGDGKAEVVVTPDQGGGPVVAVFDGAKLSAGQNEAAQAARFLGIEDPNFRGGARPALGDVNGDGTPDLLVAAGFGGGPRLAVFDGRRTLTGGGLPPKLVGDFFVFEETLRNGVFVAAGDLTGDGAAEVIVGGGPGGGPRVMALDGRALVGGSQAPVANFFAGDPNARGGVRVAVRPGADGTPQLVTGSGANEAAAVRVYRPATARAAGAADQTLAPFGGAVLGDGVYVG